MPTDTGQIIWASGVHDTTAGEEREKTASRERQIYWFIQTPSNKSQQVLQNAYLFPHELIKRNNFGNRRLKVPRVFHLVGLSTSGPRHGEHDGKGIRKMSNWRQGPSQTKDQPHRQEVPHCRAAGTLTPFNHHTLTSTVLSVRCFLSVSAGYKLPSPVN